MAGVYFNGQQIFKPGAYSKVDASGMTASSVGGGRVLAVIGQAPGGTDKEDNPIVLDPTRIYWFNDATSARATLGSTDDPTTKGDLFLGASIAWAGGNSTGADLIACVPLGVDSETNLPTADSWANALSLLENVQVHGIIALSEDETVQAQVKEHINSMSTTKRRKERRGFYGHPLNTTVESVVSRVASFGTQRACLVSPGMQLAVKGTVVTLPSYYTACAVAGVWAGLPLGEPLTFKYINALGLEKHYDDLEIDTLLQAGVMVIEEVPNKGRRIVQQLTCHTEDENILYSELSVATLADFMSVDLRESLEDKFVGHPTNASIGTSIYNFAVSRLNAYKKEGWVVDYRNVVIRQNGTAFDVEWEGLPAIPINWILITSHFSIE